MSTTIFGLTVAVSIYAIALLLIGATALSIHLAREIRSDRVWRARQRIAEEIDRRNEFERAILVGAAPGSFREAKRRIETRTRIFNVSSHQRWMNHWWIPVGRLEAQVMELLDTVNEGVSMDGSDE